MFIFGGSAVILKKTKNEKLMKRITVFCGSSLGMKLYIENKHTH